MFISVITRTEDMQDPLLELVIASETTTDYDTLMKIAQIAASSDFEVTANAKINLQILEQFTMTKIPVEEQVTTVRKQYFVESSDNDFGGNDFFEYYLMNSYDIRFIED